MPSATDHSNCKCLNLTDEQVRKLTENEAANICDSLWVRWWALR